MTDGIVHTNGYHSFHHNAESDLVENDFHCHCYIDCNCVGHDGSLDLVAVEQFVDLNDGNGMGLADKKIHSVNVVSLVPDRKWLINV